MTELSALIIPKWGMTMEEATIIDWLVDEGQVLSMKQPIAELETSKVTNVLESHVAGTLVRRVGVLDEIYPCGALIGVVASDADRVSEADIDAFIAAHEHTQAEDGSERSTAHAAFVDDSTKAGDYDIHYRTMGAATDSPPIVLLHGFGADHSYWMTVQAALSADNITYALDLPGHGESSKDLPEGGTIPVFAEIVDDFISAVSVDAAHLVGHSLGGAIALALADTHPERVASLTLLAPAGLSQQINDEFLQSFTQARRRSQLKAVLEYLFHDKSFISNDLIDAVGRSKRMDGVTEALSIIRRDAFPNGVQAKVYRDTLVNLQKPVTVVWGKEDKVLSASHTEDLVDAIKVIQLANVGHMVSIEAPDPVLEAIRNTITGDR